MKKRKILALFTTLVLTISHMTGCGTEESDKANNINSYNTIGITTDEFFNNFSDDAELNRNLKNNLKTAKTDNGIDKVTTETEYITDGTFSFDFDVEASTNEIISMKSVVDYPIPPSIDDSTRSQFLATTMAFQVFPAKKFLNISQDEVSDLFISIISEKMENNGAVTQKATEDYENYYITLSINSNGTITLEIEPQNIHKQN